MQGVLSQTSNIELEPGYVFVPDSMCTALFQIHLIVRVCVHMCPDPAAALPGRQSHSSVLHDQSCAPCISWGLGI